MIETKRKRKEIKEQEERERIIATIRFSLLFVC